MTSPRYLRFAQALALCTGLATVPACPGPSGTPDSGAAPMDAPATGTDAPSTGTDAPSTGTDAPVAMTDAPSTGTDAPVAATDAPSTGTDAPIVSTDAPIQLADAPGVDICTLCRCEGPLPSDAGPDPLPDCWSVEGAGICCAVIGPLSPPDLAA